MSDVRNQFVNAVETALVDRFTENEVRMVSDVIIRVLKDYDITEHQGNLIAYEDVNEQILKRYCACLMIGGKSEKTIAQYRITIMQLFREIRKNFTDMNVYDLRLFLAVEKNRGVSNRTLENKRANLSAFFQWLTIEELIDKNPCAGIPPIKYIDKIRLPFSTVEIDRMRFACKTDKERAIIEVLLSSGVRVSELSNMQIQDVDFNKLSIHITNGKGGKQRTVYINKVALSHLQKYLANRGDLGNYLFYNKKRDQLGVCGIRYILNEIAKRANVENVHPHRFRRTFATGLANRGMDIQEIRKLLGHSNLNTTLEYVYTSDENVYTSYQKYIS